MEKGKKDEFKKIDKKGISKENIKKGKGGAACADCHIDKKNKNY